MVKVAIIEDDDVWAGKISELLRQYENEYGQKIETRRFTDGYEIVDGYTGGFDIILMDIEMGLMDGMEAAEQIRTKDEKVVIIFVTNMAQYAIRGYKVNALDYILKPITYMPFSQTLKKAIRSLDNIKETFITISLRDGTQKIRSSDINWVESQGHRLTFHTEKDEFETTVYSMKEIAEKLADEGFMRCSSGVLVNLRKVSGIRNGNIVVGNDMLSVSRGKKAEFMAALVSYMTE